MSLKPTPVARSRCKSRTRGGRKRRRPWRSWTGERGGPAERPSSPRPCSGSSSFSSFWTLASWPQNITASPPGSTTSKRAPTSSSLFFSPSRCWSRCTASAFRWEIISTGSFDLFSLSIPLFAFLLHFRDILSRCSTVSTALSWSVVYWNLFWPTMVSCPHSVYQCWGAFVSCEHSKSQGKTWPIEELAH